MAMWYARSKKYGEKNVMYDSYAWYNHMLSDASQMKHMPEVSGYQSVTGGAWVGRWVSGRAGRCVCVCVAGGRERVAGMVGWCSLDKRVSVCFTRADAVCLRFDFW